MKPTDLARNEMQGISLAKPRWALVGPRPDPSVFFGALLELVPVGVLLFLEGGSHPRELRSLLEMYDVAAPVRPALGTLWPRQRSFSLRVLPDLMGRLSELTASLPIPEICDHLHVFDGDRVLLEGHDAFHDPFLISGELDEGRLKRFCATLGCTYEDASLSGRRDR